VHSDVINLLLVPTNAQPAGQNPPRFAAPIEEEECTTNLL
jgi:hypothetical protein